MLQDFAFAAELAPGTEPRQRDDKTLRAAGVRLERAFEERLPEATYLVTFAEVDAGSPLPASAELIGEWTDPAVTKHRQGLAFAIPLRPGQAAALRDFAEEAFRHRRYEHHQSRRALGLTRESLWLAGELAIFYLEGDHPRGSYERFAASTAGHDIWFRDRCRELLREGFDLDAPLPPIRMLWDRDLSPVPA